MATHYQFHEELGRGAKGVVYRAYDPDLKRTVAIKVLRERPDAHGLGRFRQEGQAAARVQHPNVLAVHDLVVPEAGMPYLVTDYAPGGSLRDVLRTRGELPQQEIAALLSELCAGVGALHAQGVIHRDLKPDNVLFKADGAPLVADLGLARALDRETRYTQSGVLIGTPTYMAPEQLGGKTPTPATDVYALGVILFELLTGRLPFHAEGLLEQIRMLLEVPAPRPSTFVPTVDRGLEAICLRCLEKDPSSRYADASALREALLAWTPSAAPSPLGRLAALGLGLLILAGGLGLALASRAAPPPSPPPLSPSPESPPVTPEAPPEQRSSGVSLTRESFVHGDPPAKVIRAWGLRLEPEGLGMPNSRGEGPQILIPFALEDHACRLVARFQVQHLTLGASYAIRIAADHPIHTQSRPGGPPEFEAEFLPRQSKGALEHGWSLRSGRSRSSEIGFSERTEAGPFEVSLEVEFSRGKLVARAGGAAEVELPLSLERGDYWLELVALPHRYSPDDARRARSLIGPKSRLRHSMSAPGYGRLLLRELSLVSTGARAITAREAKGQWAEIGELGRQSVLPDADREAIGAGLSELAASTYPQLRNEAAFLRCAGWVRRGQSEEATRGLCNFFRANSMLEPIRQGRFAYWADAWPDLEPAGRLAMAHAYDQLFYAPGRPGTLIREDARRFHPLQPAESRSRPLGSPSEALLCLLLAKAEGEPVDPFRLGTAWLFHGGLAPALEALRGPAERGSPEALLYAGAAAYFLRDYPRAKRYWEQVHAQDPGAGPLTQRPWSFRWARLQRILPD